MSVEVRDRQINSNAVQKIPPLVFRQRCASQALTRLGMGCFIVVRRGIQNFLLLKLGFWVYFYKESENEIWFIFTSVNMLGTKKKKKEGWANCCLKKKKKKLVQFPTRLSRFGLRVFMLPETLWEVKAKDSGRVSNNLSWASGLPVVLIWKAHKKCCKSVMSIQDSDKNCLVPWCNLLRLARVLLLQKEYIVIFLSVWMMSVHILINKMLCVIYPHKSGTAEA